jgi:hypothetical protein
MIQPLLETLGGSANDRFKWFAKAVLAVPKSEVTAPVDEALSQLESQKHQIDAKIADVRRELTKRKAKSPAE